MSSASKSAVGVKKSSDLSPIQQCSKLRDVVMRFWQVVRLCRLPYAHPDYAFAPADGVLDSPLRWRGYSLGKHLVLNEALGYIMFCQLFARRRIVHDKLDVLRISSVMGTYRDRLGNVFNRVWLQLELGVRPMPEVKVQGGKNVRKAHRRQQRKHKLDVLSTPHRTVYVDVANAALMDASVSQLCVGEGRDAVPLHVFGPSDLVKPERADCDAVTVIEINALGVPEQFESFEVTCNPKDSSTGMEESVAHEAKEVEEKLEAAPVADQPAETELATGSSPAVTTEARALAEQVAAALDDDDTSLSSVINATRKRLVEPGYMLLPDTDIIDITLRIAQYCSVADNTLDRHSPLAAALNVATEGCRLQTRRAFAAAMDFIYSVGVTYDAEECVKILNSADG